MAIVKGSKVYQWSVVKARPYTRIWQAGILAALVAVAVATYFE